jgi:hypothetical protein
MARVQPQTSPGFYPQPNTWTCGPYALKHALVALGRPVDAQELASTAKTHWWSGTDEIQLARAAREHGCDLILKRRGTPDTARRELISLLREQTPVLLCVDRWEHWITVVRYEDRRFVVIDSELDPVLNVLTWAELRKRWAWHDVKHNKKAPPTLYDLMEVRPRFSTAVKADFSVDRVKFLRRPANHALARHWNEYLEDLLDICKPPSERMADALSMGEFLRRHQELLVTRVVHWHGELERDDVHRILRYLRFVSETYGLVIPAAATRRAVADLAILLTMWACTISPLADVYGDDPLKIRRRRRASTRARGRWPADRRPARARRRCSRAASSRCARTSC